MIKIKVRMKIKNTSILTSKITSFHAIFKSITMYEQNMDHSVPDAQLSLVQLFSPFFLGIETISFT